MIAMLLLLFLPPDQQADVAAGKKAFDLGRYAEAIRIWAKANGSDCQIPFFIGLAHFRQHQLPAALIQFRTAVSCAPDSILPRVALAEATAASGDQNRALALYEEALKVDPESKEALRGAALICVANQLNEKAIGLLEMLTRLSPNDSAAQAQLGAVYAAASRMEDAEKVLQSALKLDSSNPSALTALGNVYLKTGRNDEALAYLQKAAEFTKSYEPLFLLGSLYSKQGRHEDAVAEFKKAIAIDPDQPEIYYQLSVALGRLQRKDERDKALKRFTQLKADNERTGGSVRHAALLIDAAKPYVDRGELGEALRLLKQAQQLQPRSADIWFRIAGLQYDMREYEVARSSVLQAIEAAADEWRYHYLLGLIGKDAGQPAQALRAFETARRLNPMAADVHNQLGDLAMRESRFEAAADCFRRALQIDPGDGAFKANLAAALGAMERRR